MTSGAIVVTGASGFLGRRITDALLRAEFSVVALVRDPSRVAERSGLTAVAWRIGEPAPLNGAGAVVHAAAHRPTTYADPAQAATCFHDNALGTLSLVEAAASAGVPHFVYLSAGNCYRNVPGRDRPAQEDDAIWPPPRAPYYLGSKMTGEQFVDAAAQGGRILATSLRPSAIYGPEMPPGLVPTFVERLKAGEPVRVADGGRYEADLVYVDDVADATVAAVVNHATGPINIGSGETVSSLSLARTVAEVYGADPALIDVDPPVPGGRGQHGFTALDIGRARAALAFSPRPLRAGLEAMRDQGRVTR